MPAFRLSKPFLKLLLVVASIAAVVGLIWTLWIGRNILWSISVFLLDSAMIAGMLIGLGYLISFSFSRIMDFVFETRPSAPPAVRTILRSIGIAIICLQIMANGYIKFGPMAPIRDSFEDGAACAEYECYASPELLRARDELLRERGCIRLGYWWVSEGMFTHTDVTTWALYLWTGKTFSNWYWRR